MLYLLTFVQCPFSLYHVRPEQNLKALCLSKRIRGGCFAPIHIHLLSSILTMDNHQTWNSCRYEKEVCIMTESNTSVIVQATSRSPVSIT
jgi:hypothetical protein